MLIIGISIFIIGLLITFLFNDVVGIIIVCCCVYPFFVYVFYICTHYNKFLPKLTYKHFLMIHNCEPDRWYYDREDNKLIYEPDKGANQVVCFRTSIDYWLFKRFARKQQKREEEIKQIKVQADFIKSVQENLNRQNEEIVEFVKSKSQLAKIETPPVIVERYRNGKRIVEEIDQSGNQMVFAQIETCVAE